MPGTLPYEPKPVKSHPTLESRRKATRCFVGSALLSVIGLALFVATYFVSAWEVRSADSQRRGRLAACVGVLALLVFGLAVRVLNAAFYHRSGFEHRHRDN
jgi:hypothetical protein